MNVAINAKRLRATLRDVVERVRKGTRFTVFYRSRFWRRRSSQSHRNAAIITLNKSVFAM